MERTHSGVSDITVHRVVSGQVTGLNSVQRHLALCTFCKVSVLGPEVCDGNRLYKTKQMDRMRALNIGDVEYNVLIPYTCTV